MRTRQAGIVVQFREAIASIQVFVGFYEIFRARILRRISSTDDKMNKMNAA
jgi:hypothetical protein